MNSFFYDGLSKSLHLFMSNQWSLGWQPREREVHEATANSSKPLCVGGLGRNHESGFLSVINIILMSKNK